mgnify:CR=1 FL=1
MRQRPNSTPDYKRLVFLKNETRTDIYDLVDSRFQKFTFIRLSEPQKPYLIKQGAKYCIESWKDNKKTLFTGLLQFHDRIYYGDHKNAVNGCKSFLIASIEASQIVFYYFNQFSIYPKLIKGFIKRFIKENPEGFPGFSLSKLIQSYD